MFSEMPSKAPVVRYGYLPNNFEVIVEIRSGRCFPVLNLYRGLAISVKNTRARAFTPEDTVLTKNNILF